MFARIRNLFGSKPRRGDQVTVLDGPDAGKTGTVTAISGHGVTVYIDEWSEPTLAAESVQLLRRGHSAEFGPPDAGTDLDYEEARTRTRQIPPSDLV
jgi:KOW motif